MNLEIKALLELPETISRFGELGGVTVYATPDHFAAFIRSKIGKWRRVVQREGMQLKPG